MSILTSTMLTQMSWSYCIVQMVYHVLTGVLHQLTGHSQQYSSQIIAACNELSLGQANQRTAVHVLRTHKNPSNRVGPPHQMFSPLSPHGCHNDVTLFQYSKIDHKQFCPLCQVLSQFCFLRTFRTTNYLLLWEKSDKEWGQCRVSYKEQK